MLTAIVLDGLEGGVRTYAPIILAVLIADIDRGKTAAEGDIYAVLVEVLGGAVSKVTNAADVAEVVEENVVSALAGFGVVKIERAFFSIKIVLHC